MRYHKNETIAILAAVKNAKKTRRDSIDDTKPCVTYRDISTVAVLGFLFGGANGAGIFCLGGLMAIAEGKKRLPKKISDLCISPKNFIYLQKISDDLFFF